MNSGLEGAFKVHFEVFLKDESFEVHKFHDFRKNHKNYSAHDESKRKI